MQHLIWVYIVCKGLSVPILRFIGYIFCITKTCLFKYTENFTTKNWKFSDKNSDVFHISAQKHRLWVHIRAPSAKQIVGTYSLGLLCWGSSNKYPQSMFLSRNKKNSVYPSLRNHAYSNILKILPPKSGSFQIKNSDIFHISAQNIDCGYPLEPPQQGGSNAYHNLCFWAEIKTRGPWWSYIAHLSKQICILNVEVSAKFTALRFMYKFYNHDESWQLEQTW